MLPAKTGRKKKQAGKVGVWKRLDLAFLKKDKRNEGKEEGGGGRKRWRVERMGIQRDKWESATRGRKITGWKILS